MRKSTVVLLLLFMVAVPSVAQVCRDEETIADCFARLNPPGAGTPQQAASDNVAANATGSDIAKANTGDPTLDSSINTALRDFLSLFSATVASSKLTDNGNALTLDWNAVVAPLSPGNVVKLQAVFNKPALDPEVKKQLTGKSDFDSINGSLNDLDDTQFSATYAPTTANFGRALAPHRALLLAIMPQVHGSASIAKEEALFKYLKQLQKTPPFNVSAAEGVKFTDVPVAIRPELERVVAGAALEAEAFAEGLRTNVDPFRTLLSNQPQLYASAIANIRKNLVGASGGSLKVTYERGGTSLKDFYATPSGRGCTPAVLNLPGVAKGLGDTCASSFRTFATDASTAVGAAATGRWSVAAEYGRTNTNNINLPDDNISIRTGGSHKATGTLVYGAVLTRDSQNREGRFDVNLSFENYTKDPNLTNRIIASAVYSQKLTDTLILPLGIVYASHSADLPANDKQLSVHFGLVYKLTGGGK